MTPEDKLTALFAADAAPTRDHVFQSAVAERIARRRAWATVAAMAPWAIAAIAVLWALNPLIVPVASGLGEALAPAAAILGASGLAVVAALLGARRLQAI